MAGRLGRNLACLLLFGVGAQALGGGAVGVIGSAIVALAANRAWKAQQHADARARHAADVIADERLRADVRAVHQHAAERPTEPPAGRAA
jgi:hypothetical protein